MRMLVFVLLAAAASAQQAPEAEPSVSSEQLEQQHLRQMLTLRRVYVDRLTGGDTAAQIRDMVIAALQRSRLFIVTEDESRADAYMRGSGEDLIYSEVRASRVDALDLVDALAPLRQLVGRSARTFLGNRHLPLRS